MLLAIDIGNSNITLGGIQEGEILFEARLATDSTKTSDEYGVEIKDMLDLFGARVEEIRDCIVASVVPPGVQLRPQRHREADGEGAHGGRPWHQDRDQHPAGGPGGPPGRT